MLEFKGKTLVEAQHNAVRSLLENPEDTDYARVDILMGYSAAPGNVRAVIAHNGLREPMLGLCTFNLGSKYQPDRW